ncbi:MAG: hypothetical protein ABIC18_00795 [Candidatus Omnitrophota bacterium]
MSIIYDALKRAEEKKGKNYDGNIRVSRRNNFKFLRLIYIASIIIIAGLVKILISKSFFNLPLAFNTPASDVASLRISDTGLMPFSAKRVSANKAVSDFSVNGIFLSNNEYIALIDNQMLKVGDYIDGAQLVSISPNGVEIQFKGITYRINYP